MAHPCPELVLDVRPGPSELAEQRELRSIVIGLPEPLNKILSLYYFDGYTQEEIASLLKTAQQTVSDRLAEGVAYLRKHYGEDLR